MRLKSKLKVTLAKVQFSEGSPAINSGSIFRIAGHRKFIYEYSPISTRNENGW